MKGAGELLTLLAVGDDVDFDSFMKFHHHHELLNKYNIDYVYISYKALLKNKVPQITTRNIIIFLFFPFDYWNKKIEPKRYKGIYANKSFYEKFVHFFNSVEESIRRNFKNKQVFFINSPTLSCNYRDKLLVKEIIANSGIPTPRFFKDIDLNTIYDYLNRDKSFFLKVRYGSMGKGITYLSKSNWQTNFTFRSNRILSHKSDYGWTFKNVTGNEAFLKKLLMTDIYTEETIDFMSSAKRKFDLRIYVFFNRVVFIYPRSNDCKKITTNISQGGKGHSARFLNKIPPHLIASAQKIALKTARTLGLNFAGVDISIDKNLKDIFVFEVNIFPGFPKKRIFDLGKHLITQIGNSYLENGLSYFKKNLKSFISVHPYACKRRIVIFDYESRFLPDIERTILRYNSEHPDNSFSLDIYKACACTYESEAGPADIILHTGGVGRLVKEDIRGIPKLHIGHSHKWKARQLGGKLVRLKTFRRGIECINVLEDDEILGKKGEMYIMQYSRFAITKAPQDAAILATSKAIDHLGKHIEIIEALRYDDGSMDILGHPEEGTAAHIIYNLLEKVNSKIH
ncbi:MAG: hypothetical protein ISS47_08330 [Candidatus Omnitrophica bacterium]|nr:hypothetical protein [Candidatus Omnitrophota bacterium]